MIYEVTNVVIETSAGYDLFYSHVYDRYFY